MPPESTLDQASDANIRHRQSRLARLETVQAVLIALVVFIGLIVIIEVASPWFKPVAPADSGALGSGFIPAEWRTTVGMLAILAFAVNAAAFAYYLLGKRTNDELDQMINKEFDETRIRLDIEILKTEVKLLAARRDNIDGEPKRSQES